MIRSHADIALLIPFLVIGGQGFASRLGCSLVEPALRHDAANRLDAKLRRSPPLIWNGGIDLELGIRKVLFVPLAGNVVLVHPVMGKPKDCLFVSALAQPIGMKPSHLTD